jgi:hypothetical protein
VGGCFAAQREQALTEQIATLWFLRLKIHIDRSHAPAWECRQGRSAFRFWKVTQSVTGCIPTQSVGTIKYVGFAFGKDVYLLSRINVIQHPIRQQ